MCARSFAFALQSAAPSRTGWWTRITEHPNGCGAGNGFDGCGSVTLAGCPMSNQDDPVVSAQTMVRGSAPNFGSLGPTATQRTTTENRNPHAGHGQNPHGSRGMPWGDQARARCAITPLSLCLDRRVLAHCHRSRPAGSITPPRASIRGQVLCPRGTGRWNGPLRKALTRMVPAVSPPPYHMRIACERGNPAPLSSFLLFCPWRCVRSNVRRSDRTVRPPGPVRGFATDSEQARIRNS